MNHSIRKGFSFGLTSGIITTLGIIVGLNASTNSKIVVLGGILVIAIADALSDALGIHISEESEAKHTSKEIWQATGATFITKFVIALTFIIPILLLDLFSAIILSVFWGMALLAGLSFYIGKKEHGRPWHVVAEHLGIAILVVIITHLLGTWVAAFA